MAHACTLVLPEFKANPGYIERPCLKQKKCINHECIMGQLIFTSCPMHGMHIQMRNRTL